MEGPTSGCSRLMRLSAHVVGGSLCAGDAVGNDCSSLAAGCSSGVDGNSQALATALASFRERGFLLMDGLLSGSSVFLRAQAAYRSLRPEFVKMFNADSQVLNCPAALEKDVALIELIEAPELLPIMAGIVGDDVQIREFALQAYPPQDPQVVQDSGGYTGWHRDRPAFMHPRLSLFTKMFIYMNDIGPRGGCTALVPGSHRWAEAPKKADFKGWGGDKEQDEMEGVERQSACAGSVLFFDSRAHHTAMANESSVERQLMIVNLCPFWHKQFGPVIDGARRLDERGVLNTPLRRQLFGLELAGDVVEGLSGVGTSQGAAGTNPYREGYTKPGYW